MPHEASPDLTLKLFALLHVLAATAWVGGHIVLLTVVLPRALRDGDPQRVRDFEQGFGRVGLAALAVLVASGFWLAINAVADWGAFLSLPNPESRLVAVKLGLLVATVVVAAHGHRRVLPQLAPGRMRPFAIHACIATALAVLMLVVGVALRFAAPS
jgi:putative copper export protein